MPKYRGFMNESLGHYDTSPISGGSKIDRFSLNGLGRMTSFGTGRVYAPAPAPAPVVAVAAPAPVPIPIDRRATIMPVYGIPGDIRPITARIIPGEAIETDPAELNARMVDNMWAENGIPGVDDSGAFPYGDPKAAEKAPTKPGENQGLIIAAAIAAALFLGG